ncbi:hypothetical protein U9M48_013222 [Paspalum notatum var. saurae]|uniref:Uncharacterized protein n=1 Tax=Paspalum notatum var. saurae TaxID=547442 RepID=A0AAQ3WJ22_PASNO
MMRIGTASSLHGANSFRRQPRPSSSPRVDNVGDSGHASNGECLRVACATGAQVLEDETDDDHSYDGRR